MRQLTSTENPMSQIENSALLNEIINVEELEEKLAPSASWALSDS